MLMLNKTLLSFLVILFTLDNITAQIPQAFNYQGVARDLSGSPLPQNTIGLSISILADSPGGTTMYAETHTVTTSDLGLFTIQVGSGNVIDGSFESIDWGTGDYYIQVALDVNGGSTFEIVSTSQLLSVPYAMHAGNGSPWKMLENGLHYPNKVTLGKEIGDQYNSNLNIYDDENTDSGIQIYNPNRDAREIVAIGEGDQQRYIYMAYQNAERTEDDGGAFKSNAGFIFTGGTNGLNLISAREDIHFIAGGVEEENKRMLIKANGNIGIGSPNPTTKLQVSDGDIYIEDMSKGVIMKSPDGACWRMTVSITGQSVFNAIDCPK